MITTASFEPQEKKAKVNENKMERMVKVWLESDKTSDSKIKKSKKNYKLFLEQKRLMDKSLCWLIKK